jgi:pimeloyl-ACP methyl ester carboxylesterase
MQILPGIGHFPHLEAPAEVTAALRELMASELAADRF